VSQGLHGVRERARKNKQERFTALLHHVTPELLRESFYALKRKAAPGVDGMTWQEYATGLEDRLKDLHGRVHRGAYQAQPSKRRWIPKANGKQRPLGIAALEDKIVQQAVVTVLNEIYEEDFRGFSYGFRPNPRLQPFLDQAQNPGIGDSFLDELDQLFVWSETEAGTPQGAVISPLLSNVYLHYVLDQWTDRWRQAARGEITIVRYADDAILGFQHQDEAERYLRELKEHLRAYGLELNEEKTRLIRFGRFAALNRAERGEGKPEAFTFLGFQHVCGKNKLGRFEVRRITDGKRRRKKLQELKQELRRRMHAPIAMVGGWLRSVLHGYYQYHAVLENLPVLSRFRHQVARHWFRTLSQRSQRRPTWKQLGPVFNHWLPIPQLVHDYPDARFDARLRKGSHPR